MSSSSTPSESGIELVARSFDLLSAIVNSSQPSSAIARSTQELVKWLARECVQESVFTQCAQLARSLAYPNDDALVIRSSIAEADIKLHTLQAPLRLIKSGSLGRLIAQDPEFSYMVTTVTSLSRFYKIDRITDTVCSMMLDHNENVTSAEYQYQVQRAPIRAVTLKIVESISRNVVNAGHHLQGIPEELSHLHVHLVDPYAFAALVRGIREAKDDIVLRCERFIGDITMWLLNHFHGCFEVILRSQLLLKRELGSEKQTVRFFITNECAASTPCYLRECSIEASVSTGSGLHTSFFHGATSADTPESRPMPQARASLYREDMCSSFPVSPRKATLNREQKLHIEMTAKKIMTWLIRLPVEAASASSFQLTFKARLDGSDGPFRLGDLLSRHPCLFQKHKSAPSFTAPAFDDVRGKIDQEAGLLPPATDLMNEVKSSCTCLHCERDGAINHAPLGCLRQLAFAELFTTLAHAVSDGLGAEDVSGLSEPSHVVAVLLPLFHTLLRKELIIWDDWMRVFAVTVGGASMDSFATNDKGKALSGATSIVAFQYGVFTGMVPWINFESEVQPRHCFSVQIFEGNIDGLAEEFGIVRCEKGMEAMGLDPSARQTTHMEAEDLDEDGIRIQTAIFRVGTSSYRLMTLVASGNTGESSIRPPLSMRQHEGKQDEVAIDVYKFDDILAEWDGSSSTGNDEVQTTKMITSRSKFNVILALSVYGVVVYEPGAVCWGCAVQQTLQTLAGKPLRLVKLGSMERSLLGV
ncbi:hypothetical protein PG993_000568 [Apiospora rasikravindrae]|uniref:Uncharacterized protein n=1 Tax=Apiospora rasikravindrae TaxID=990691 RepID=A0ABR1UB08_9PEZI